jgi:hypothetical protein
MAKYAHITNSVVDDMISADAEFISILDNASEWVNTTGISVGIGYNYNGTSFYLPQPYPSWTLDAELKWVAPIQKPDDGQKYKWDESIQNWVISLTKSTANPVETPVNLDTTTA